MNGVIRSKFAHCRQSALNLRIPFWAAYAGYVASLVVLVMVAGEASVRLGATVAVHTVHTANLAAHGSKLATSMRRSTPVPGETHTASMIATNDDWAAQLRDPAYWAARRGEKTKSSERFQRSGLTRAEPGLDFFGITSISRGKPKAGSGDDENGSSQAPSRDKTFRTVCVRLCDGYFWPISFATTEENFDRDRASCERSCDGPVRLYTYRNPGSDLEDMEDLTGQSYKRLPTAFQFRTKFEPVCKCKPHPWEQEAKDRHQLYALETQRAKLSKQAAMDATPAIKELKAKVSEATLASKAAAKAAQTVLDTDAANKQRATRKSASKGGRDRSGLEIASVEQSKSSLPASDGVVIMRLGSRPPVAVKVDPSSRKRASRDPMAQ